MQQAKKTPVRLGPAALTVSTRGRLYTALEHARRIDVFDLPGLKKNGTIELPDRPSGLCLGPDEQKLYVTCGLDKGRLCEIDTKRRKIKRITAVGHSPCAPVCCQNGQTLFLCNRFAGRLTRIDLAKFTVLSSGPIGREPIAACFAENDSILAVASHLPDAAAGTDSAAACIRFYNRFSGTVKSVRLPPGSSGVRNITPTADRRYILVPHILARSGVPTSQLEQGWMNTNVMSLLDGKNLKWTATVVLDEVDKGAANPWDAAVSDDGKTVCVTHAGSHEAGLIDLAGLFEKMAVANTPPHLKLNFLYGLLRRIPLPGTGPRPAGSFDGSFYIGEYFSEALVRVDMRHRPVRLCSIPLGPKTGKSRPDTGEMLFHDARLCFQRWQSCASCHPDGRADGLNWDLLNDGLGNPKNAKSLLYAHATPPAMCTGVRPNAEYAVRAGMSHIQFAQRSEKEARAMDAWLKSLRPVPSPYRTGGKPGPAARRGKKLFFSPRVGCAGCHPPPYYTDMRLHDTGTATPVDSTLDETGRRVLQAAYDTPSLIEVWRTAPYMHDGRYHSIFDVVTKGNHGDLRGHTSHLTDKEIRDLVEFVLSL